MRYIGLDVHIATTTACIISAGGKNLGMIETSSDADGLAAIRDHMRQDEYCVMMESSTYAYPVYRFFEALGVETHAVHAASLKMVTKSVKKTDRHDAEVIGKMLRLWKRREVELSIAFIPTPEQCELKDICRYREEITVKLGRDVQRIQSQMYRNCQKLPPEFSDLETRKARSYIRKNWSGDLTLMKRLDQYEEMLKERNTVAKEVISRMKGDPNAALLEAIPGIGRQTAVQLMSMIIDVNRFPDGEKICAYFGMVPRTRDTGGKQIRGKMTKNGDKMMRSILERVTVSHAMYCDSDITRYYRRMIPKLGKKKALTAASRKMLMAIHAVLKSGKPFVP